MDLFFDLETHGLNSEQDAISVIGVLYRDGVRQFYGKEKDILRDFNDWLTLLAVKGEELRLVTFNGTNFDLPFLSKRYAKNGLLLEAGFSHLDLAPIVWAKFARPGDSPEDLHHRLGKDAVCAKYGIYVPRAPVSAFECALLGKKGDASPIEWAGVLLHNAIDLYATLALFEKLKRFG